MIPLPDLIRLAGEQAHKILLELREPQLVPTYILLSPTTQRVIACPWENDTMKAIMVEAVRREAADIGAERLSFLTEMWATDSREAPDALMIRPSQHPKRREFVVAYATDGETIESARWQIIRDRPGGRIMLLAAGPVLDGEIVHNRFVDTILPKRAA